MQITHSWTVTTDPDQAYADTTQVEFQNDKCEEAGALKFECEVTEQDGGHVVTVKRLMPSGDVPDLVKKIVGDKVDIVEVVTWGARESDGSRHGVLDVAFKGQPISLKGTTRIEPDGTGSKVTVEADLKAKIPVVGGKIEKISGPEVLKSLQAEETTSHTWAERSA